MLGLPIVEINGRLHYYTPPKMTTYFIMRAVLGGNDVLRYYRPRVLRALSSHEVKAYRARERK